MFAIGIMSGTSLDGVDICLTKITKRKKYEYEIVDFRSYPYSKDIVNKILEVSNITTSNVQKICSLNFELSYVYIDCIKKFIKDTSFDINKVSFIALHGQTIWHNPNNLNGYVSSTMQIGEASVIAYEFNIKVISNFRSVDIASGGCGAPLIPFVDYILYNNDEKNIALQNIGGIGNVCYIKKNATIDDVIAFDTGPGNMLIDDAMRLLYNKPYDEGGSIAKSGMVIKKILDELLEDEYIKLPYPKSTGREKYNEEFLNKIINKAKSLNRPSCDIITTITAYTAYTIFYAYKNFLKDIDEVIVSGGGSHNEYIIETLKNLLKTDVIVENRTDAFEAFGFAILGHMTTLKKPSNIPCVTGAKEPVILGDITYPPRKYRS